MHVKNKVILAAFVILGVATVLDAACQAQSVTALKKMLLASGGTLNPQLVAIDAAGARRFKSHFTNLNVEVHRVSTSRRRRKKKREDMNDVDNDEDVIEDEELNDIDDNDDYEPRRRPGRSRKRRSTTIGNCFGPGTPLNNMHLLCHICDSTTALSSDYFPQYVNEVICNPDKTQFCFQGQGKCSPNSVPVVFLKKTGKCVSNGSGILLEEWQPETKYLSTCCECRLYPGSFLVALTQ